MVSRTKCVFCSACSDKYKIVAENNSALCMISTEPLKKGHALVLPKRHVSVLSELNAEESKALLDLIDAIRRGEEGAFNETPLVVLEGDSSKNNSHLYFNILPSKGTLRKMVGLFEGVAEQRTASSEELLITRDVLRLHL